jgi:hypothetical protein
MSDPIRIDNIQPGDYVRLKHLTGCKFRVGEVDRFNESLLLFWENGEEAGNYNIDEVVWFNATERFI